MRATGNGRRARRGLTLVELVISMTMLTVILGAVALATLRGNDAYNTGRTVAELETRAQRIVSQIAQELRGARRAGLVPDPLPPFGSSTLDYQVNTGFAGGAVAWSAPLRISFDYSPGEVDDGADNDSNGIADEGSAVWRRNPGAANEERVVWGNWVREFLEGEVPNGADDNGNGLIDERGLCFQAAGDTLTIRLTLERRDPDQRLITRTVETAVGLRN
jgi:type II secretory pathway pseudopilin PulG